MFTVHEVYVVERRDSHGLEVEGVQRNKCKTSSFLSCLIVDMILQTLVRDLASDMGRLGPRPSLLVY